VPHTHGHDHPLTPGPAGATPVLGRRTVVLGLGAILLSACRSGSTGEEPAAGPTTAQSAGAPTTAVATTTTLPTPTTTAVQSPGATGVPAGFEAFADTVRVLAEGDHWLIESTGLPAHEMMTGIVSWQQQVPTPQPYTDGNAWRLPRHPQLADTPISARTALYRGAIALAVNGVPIFNALNNRGDDAYLVGELDRWGGHSGRADDYHYHLPPLHLQAAVGAGAPIAYALDGFPLYGPTEADGTPVIGLDELNGHLGPDGYHYHATPAYPYLNGGLRGVVTVVDDQVEPQPALRPFRPALTPLRGATITGFRSPGTGSYQLDYEISGRPARVDYTVADGGVWFRFTDIDGTVRTETYRR